MVGLSIVSGFMSGAWPQATDKKPGTVAGLTVIQFLNALLATMPGLIARHGFRLHQKNGEMTACRQILLFAWNIGPVVFVPVHAGAS